jgi:[CysO sulfur-carrier protein]-thiocarboxylate-dependent cysteine synthase
MVDGLRSLDDGYVPPIFTDLGGPDLLDRKTVINARESIDWTRRLVEVGVFAGVSTGAAMSGAARCAQSIESGVIVVVSPDGGWKYLSTGVWFGSIEEAVERTEGTTYF